MDKICREGADLCVVFLSHNHHHKSLQTLIEPISLKMKVRRFAKLIYKNVIPTYIRPFAFRVYKFLVNNTKAIYGFCKRTKKHKGIIVIGAGGHAKVCIELLHAMGEKVAYCVGGGGSPDFCMGIPVYRSNSSLDYLRSEGYYRAFIAIGDNKLRQTLAGKLLKQGYQFVNAISPHAVISPSARLGVGVAIMGGAVINADATIGDLVIVNTGASIDHDCRVESAAHIAPQCGLAGNVVVGAGSFLGVGCSVIPGIVIGKNVIVGAGGVVVTDLDDQTKAVGVPAKKVVVKIKEIC